MNIKTKIRLEETLVKEAKRKASEEDETLQEVVSKALIKYIFGRGKRFNRSGLYKDYLDRKFKSIKTIYRSPLLEMAEQAVGEKKGKKKDFAAKIDQYLYGER